MSELYWRVEGKLDKRSRRVADEFDELVARHRIGAYRRSTSGVWSVLPYGRPGFTIGTVSNAEAFLKGTKT